MRVRAHTYLQRHTGQPLNKKLPFWAESLARRRSVWDHLGPCSGFSTRSKSGGFAPRPRQEPIPLDLETFFSIFDLKKFAFQGLVFLFNAFLIRPPTRMRVCMLMRSGACTCALAFTLHVQSQACRAAWDVLTRKSEHFRVNCVLSRL